MTMGLLGIYISVYQSIISVISKNYLISETILGMIISLHFIGSLIAPVIFGEISDRIGKKKVVIISIIFIITGLLTIYIFSNLMYIAIGIFIIGCGFAVIEGSLSGLLIEINKEGLDKAINISQMFLSIGAVIGPLLTLLFTNLSGSWKINFLLMIVSFLLILMLFSKLNFVEKDYIVQNHKGLILVELFKDKILIIMCLSIFIYVGIEEGIAFWLGAYFTESYNTAQMGNYALSAYWASMIIGRYVASKIDNKQDVLLKGGLLTSLIFITITLLIQNSIVSLVSFIGVGLGFSVIWPIIISKTARKYPEYSGTVMGIMMTAGAGGGIGIPFIMGVIVNYSRIKLIFYIIPILIITLLILQNQIRTKQIFLSTVKQVEFE